MRGIELSLPQRCVRHSASPDWDIDEAFLAEQGGRGLVVAGYSDKMVAFGAPGSGGYRCETVLKTLTDVWPIAEKTVPRRALDQR